MQPLVSILTLTYNHEKYIGDCIDSVQAQTYENWEMLIIDDGSTDGTAAVAQSFADSDKRIKVFPRENIGVFRMKENYNFALEKSAGKYIAILDGDDIWLPEKLELQITELERDNDIVLSFGQSYNSSNDLSVNQNLSITKKIDLEILNNNPVKSALKTLIFYDFIPALTAVVRKDVLNKIGGFVQYENFPVVDISTWCVLAKIGKFAYIEHPLGKWRYSLSQTTKQNVAEIAQGHFDLALKIYKKNKNFFKENSKITLSDIKKYHYKLLINSYSRSGRFKLIRKDFIGARKDYLKSIFRFGFYEPVWKLRSAVGILFSFAHLNIENFAKKLGRPHYKN